MTRRGSLPTMRIGTAVRSMTLAAPVARILTEQERGHAERQKLYRSRRWKQERRAFLKANPFCQQETPRGQCARRATIVDHVDGHQRPDWMARFWDRRTWQPMCRTCHAAKSARELAAWNQAGSSMGGGQVKKVNDLGPGYRVGSSRESGQSQQLFYPEKKR
jgi:5-methylcytosine-specific restriction endonuclease McrA